MLVIWRGWGILAPIVPILSWSLVPLALRPLLAEAVYKEYFAVATATSLLLGSIALWFLGRRLNSGERKLLDEQTGEQVILKPNHSLFFIKMQYWSIPFAAFAILLIIPSL